MAFPPVHHPLPMPAASEIEPVCQGIFLWRFYDPAVKAELFSTGLESPGGTYLIDPIPLMAKAFRSLATQADIAGIVVTNENHERAAGEFSRTFEVPVHLHSALVVATKLPKVVALQDHLAFLPGLTAVDIEGGPVGEIAVHADANGGSMIIGDALINFDPYGFALLPSKYCSNAKMMRRSLSKLLDYSFERILFAHGIPILSRAHQRLEELLKGHC